MYRSTTKAQSLFESGQDKMSSKATTSGAAKTKGGAGRNTKTGGKGENILDAIDEAEE